MFVWIHRGDIRLCLTCRFLYVLHSFASPLVRAFVCVAFSQDGSLLIFVSLSNYYRMRRLGTSDISPCSYCFLSLFQLFFCRLLSSAFFSSQRSEEALTELPWMPHRLACKSRRSDLTQMSTPLFDSLFTHHILLNTEDFYECR